MGKTKGASVAFFKYSEECGYEMFLVKEVNSKKWSLPGGNFLEGSDKNFYDCLQRSLSEKLGLNLFEIVQFNPPIMSKSKNLFVNWETYIFELGQDFDLSNLKSEVYSQAKFLSLDEFPDNKFDMEVKKAMEVFAKSFEVETKKSSALNTFLTKCKHSVEIFTDK